MNILFNRFLSLSHYIGVAIVLFTLCFTLVPIPASAQDYADSALYAEIRKNLELEKASLNQNTENQIQGNSDIPVEGTVSCFNHYSFGSVEATVLTSVGTVVQGSTATFSGSIRNNNPYPIVDGTLVAKIFKISETGEKNIQGPDVVDSFVVKTDISVKAKESIPYKFEWKAPHYIESGRYRVVTFFVAGGKFNLLGLTFTDDIVGNSAEFTVAGEVGAVRFDKSKVSVAGNQYYFAAYPPLVSSSEPIEIKATLTNTTKKNQNIPVTWRLYHWDAQAKSNFIEEATEVVIIPAGESKEIVYKAKDSVHPVYYLTAEAQYQDTKSILGIRFIRENKNGLRINFPAVKQYPLIKGQPVELFSCMHATNDSMPPAEGQMVLSILDSKGKKVHTYTYSGLITSQMMGVLDTFTPKRNIENFTLKAELFNGSELVDSAEMKYSCEKLNPLGPCRSDIQFPWWGYGALLIILIAIGLIMKKRKISVALILLGIGISIMSTPATVEAKEVQWNTVHQGQLYIRDIRDGVNKTQLTNPNITITYKAEISKSTGEVLQGGETLPVGTELRLRFIPHASEHVYWFGTGSSWDSPYGEWREGATPPPESCQQKDLVFKDGWISAKPPIQIGTRNHYFPLVIDPPTKSLVDLQNLTCGTVNISGVTNCTVSGEGPVTVSFNFAETQGKFYYRRAFELTNQNILNQIQRERELYERCKNVPATEARHTECRSSALRSLGPNATNAQIEARLDELYFPRFTCYGPNPDTPMWVRGESEPFILNVPQREVRYTFNATDVANQPPTNPIITGPTSGFAGQQYEFTFISTDADGDQLKYGIGWLGTENVNQWSPSTGFMDQNVLQREVKSWATPGTYTFKVMAQDDNGATSPGWATHTIVISPAPATDIICSASPAPSVIGNEITWTATLLTGNPMLYTFTWTGAVSGFTQSVTSRYTDQGLKTARVTATGEGRTISTECTVNITDPNNTGQCIPGSPNCISSCGPTVSVAESQGLSISSPGLCASGANLISTSFAVRPLDDRWVWTCQAPTQLYSQACSASCAIGTQYCPASGTCERNCDFCPNLDGIQSNRAQYTIDDSGNCTSVQDASIRYFRFNPDTSNGSCKAYWETAKVGAAVVSCQIGGNPVPESNPLSGGQSTFGVETGRRHTLTCEVTSDEGVFIKTLSSVARCYRVGEVKEN